MLDRNRPMVIVTGSSGLIGRRVVERLAPEYRVIGLDVEEPGRLPDGAAFRECDLTSDEKTARALRRVRGEQGDRVASVIHLAAYYDFSGEPSPLYRELTVLGTSRLLGELWRLFKVEQLVFSSSLLVMKPAAEGDALDESGPVQAEWDYPESKLEAERVIRTQRGRIPAVILRIAGVYDEGGHSPPIAQQIWRIREKKPEGFLFPGNRGHGQSFVHLEDAAACICAAVERRGELLPFEIFLVGEPETLSYGELQDAIGRLLHGRDWPTLRVPGPLAKAGAWLRDKLPVGPESFIKPWMIDLADAHYPVSIERARERLGWEPKQRLARVLPAVIAKLREDPRAWYEENDLPLDDEEG